MTGAPASPGAIAPLQLPDPIRLFADRAARLEALAPGHAAGDWLALLARIARGQAAAVREIRLSNRGLALPRARPLDPSRVERGAASRRLLGVILNGVRGGDLPDPARRAIDELARAPEPRLVDLEEAVLADRVAPDALASAPFAAAALQALFTSLAAQLEPGSVEASGEGCPVCGSPPVAGLVLGDDRLRYLGCSLCGTRWHLTRVHCALCRTPAGLSYFAVDGDEGAKAEACGACRAYVKQFDLAKRQGAEPLADDAATLALDLLMAEEGFGRGGVNLLLSSAG